MFGVTPLSQSRSNGASGAGIVCRKLKSSEAALQFLLGVKNYIASCSSCRDLSSQLLSAILLSKRLTVTGFIGSVDKSLGDPSDICTMSQNPQDNQNQPYPLRLPNYRFLHQGRYHPYPTFNRQQGAFTHETDDVEIVDAPIIPTNEAGPSTSTQQGPSVTSEPQPVADEQGDVGLENLAVIVTELEGTSSGSSAPRDSVALVVDFASAMRSQTSAAKTRTRD